MSTVITDLVCTQKKSSLSQEQKAFNRLQKKIEALQLDLQTRAKELDQCLLFYVEQVKPEEIKLATHFVSLVKSLYEVYEGDKRLQKTTRNRLKEIILDKMNPIFALLDQTAIPDEIKKIFKELEGIDFDEMISEELDGLKDGLREMGKEFGVDLDLSDVSLEDSQADIVNKIAEAIGRCSSNETVKSAPKAKTKKQIEKEKRLNELEEMQKKGLHTIYKQLAKVFHPDLEQDAILKVEKEQLMKKLTNAYDHNDLSTLLSLEMQWMTMSGGLQKSPEKGQLKLYNSILQEQVHMLQESKDALFSHPKYFPIHRCFQSVFRGFSHLKMVYKALKAEQDDVRVAIETLRTPKGRASFLLSLSN